MNESWVTNTCHFAASNRVGVASISAFGLSEADDEVAGLIEASGEAFGGDAAHDSVTLRGRHSLPRLRSIANLYIS